jgi:kynurenine formamidase
MRWEKRPSGSNWGDFGPDDRLGRVNLIDRRKVLQGIAEVREGLTFSLSLPLDVGYWLNPDRTGPRLVANRTSDGLPFMNYPLRRLCGHYSDVVCDDAVTLDLQFSTQWDALGHVGSHFDADGDGTAERVYYNGYRPDGPGNGQGMQGADATGQSAHLGPLGIEHMARAGMQGRAVLVDLGAHFGTEPRSVGCADLMHVLARDAINIEPGDVLCLRTGIDQIMLNRSSASSLPDEAPGASLDGRDQRLLQWVADSGIAAIVSDHPAVETYPPRRGSGERYPMLSLHELCLFKLGIPLGELWLLSPLAAWLRAHGRSRFLLTAPPLNLPGAAGSPVTPIATV